MTTHRYERRAIVGDFIRGGFGLLLTVGPVLLMPMVTWLAVAFSAFAALFAVYLFRTWLRSATALEVDDGGIRSTGPFGRAIRWDALDALDLRYFATRRDKEGGWMQVKLRGDGAAIAAESSLDGFETVVARAADAATRNRLALSDVTRENLKALGLVAGAPDGPMPGGMAPGGTAPDNDDRMGMR
ncbi:hypothetical protein GCM10017083_01080 [Thalassobaculum fulvum]|uniref:PH domain-containing protein n=1 Tax=Thalassobaculum fulvum TaxID=1633335 RepID=A0A918XNA2_9PROT|nr:hypothetical protein [Thalassobaculum fulvum]GHD39336.1 hypothetical protein GCM10017083_01080 [Thalassobaculum fulvum]